MNSYFIAFSLNLLSSVYNKKRLSKLLDEVVGVEMDGHLHVDATNQLLPEYFTFTMNLA